MKPTPKGFPRISPSLYYEDPHQAIDWLGRAFGFQVRLKVEDDQGNVIHSELTFGDGVIMVSGKKGRESDPKWNLRSSPRQAGGQNTQNLMVYVDDIEAHHDRAIAAGAKIDAPIELHDYGDEYWADRSYGAIDCDGHTWWFAERLRG